MRDIQPYGTRQSADGRGRLAGSVCVQSGIWCWGKGASTRVKDLVELALIVTEFVLDAQRLRTALEATLDPMITRADVSLTPLTPRSTTAWTRRG